MQYILTLFVDEAGWPRLTQPEQERGMAAYAAFNQALEAAGVLRAAGRLRPSATARTVRATNGRSVVLDGPFAETKEQLAGYFIIEVADLDAATTWASRCPATGHGVVEVRQLWD